MARSSVPFLKSILVAVDGSGMAEHAFRFALRLARQYDSELIICTALDYAGAINAGATPATAYQPLPVVYEEYESTARALLFDAATRAQAAGARATTMLLEGRPVPAILAAANARNVAAIVMGTKGKRDLELMVLGSTADGVLRLSDVPTFVVNQSRSETGKPFDAAEPTISRILVALDDSDPADGAMDFALALATAADSVVICCSAVATGQLVDNAAIYGCDPAPFVREAREAALARLDAETTRAVTPRRRIERVILEGEAVDAILAAATERKVDVIVCGSHGRRGLRRLMMGSVAESLVRRSAVPVAVVRKRPIALATAVTHQAPGETSDHARTA
jgi:nucleotide-binding universal stress UspA family protein